MKEDALQKGLPVPNEAATRGRVLRKNVKFPDLATLKDFFRFIAAASKGIIYKKKGPPTRLTRLRNGSSPTLVVL
jgi:hypothetical protein